MPFIVKQGTDDDEGAKEENPNLFEDNLKRGGYLSKGASEDLALKLYFVSTPGPFDKKAETTTTLVGNKQFIGVDDDPSEDEDEFDSRVHHAPKSEKGYFEQFDHDATVLQKLRMMRKVKGVLNDDSMGGALLRLLKASEEKKTWAKNGRRLDIVEDSDPSHSFQDVMNWALKHTELYSSDLQANFVTQIREADAFAGVYDRTKEIFERDVSRPAESLSELAVFYSEQMERYHYQMNVMREVASSESIDQQLKYHEEKRRRSVLPETFGSPSRVSPTGFGRVGRRKSSVSPKSVPMGTALSPRAQADFTKGKMKSLGQKLDFIADDRKDDFLRSVDPFGGLGSPTFFGSKERRRSSMSAKAGAQPPLTSKPSKGGFRRKNSSSCSKLVNTSGQREVSFSGDQEEADADANQALSDKVITSNPVYVVDEDDNLKVNLRSSPAKNAPAPPSKPRSKKPPVPRQRAKQSVIDPNKRPVSYSNGAVGDPSTMNAVTKRAMALADAKEKAFKAELDTVLMLHREKVKKTQKLAKRGERKQKAFMARSEDVYEKLKSFDSQVEKEAEKVKLNFQDLEIQYNTTMKIKSEAWNRNKEFKSALTDMKVMARQTKAIESFSKNANLITPKWFPSFSKTIKELISRAAVLDPIPLSCWKLLTVVQKIVMKGYTFTQYRFYAVLEATIEDVEVLRKVNVHKILKALRDCCGLRSEDFLKYHELRGIQPCPELVAHIKATQRKRTRINHFKPNKVSSPKDTSSGLRVIVESGVELDSTLGSPKAFASPMPMDPGQQTGTTMESFTFSGSNPLTPIRSAELLEELHSDVSSGSDSPRVLSRAQTPRSDVVE